MLDRLEHLLASPRAGWLAAALVCLLGLPALGTGLMTDDYWLKSAVDGIPGFQEPRPAWDLFAWYRQTEIRELMDRGVLPWWTLPESRFALWRPLSSMTHWVDFKLWPGVPALMHAQNVLWLALLVLLVFRLVRRLDGATWVAGLATLAYAVDDARAIPLGSIANRNGLLATCAAVGALLLHVRWRAEGSRGAAVLAPVLLLVGLLCNEGAVAVLAYLAAYAVFLDRGAWRARVASLAPAVLVVIAWRVVYRAGGYGVWGVDRYADPLLQPLLFAEAAAFRGPLLLFGQWALPPFGVKLLPDAGNAALWLACVTLLAGVGALLAPFLREERTSRFWLAAMLASVVPACAVEATPRLLLFAGIGACALLARFVAAVYERRYVPSWRWVRPLVRPAYVGFVTIHFLLAPLLLVATYSTFHLFWSAADTAIRQAPVEGAPRTLVLVNSRRLTKFLPLLWGLDGRPVPERMRYLGPSLVAGVPIRLTRLDARTLVVRPEGGFYGKGRHERGRRFAGGDRLEFPGMDVEIREVDDRGMPTEAAFVFDVPLEDPSLVWLERRGQGFRVFRPPAPGATVTIDKG